MARYHLSPKDGQPRVCSARIKCDYADANDGKGVEHYPNKAAAMAACAANEAKKNETFNSVKKPKAPNVEVKSDNFNPTKAEIEKVLNSSKMLSTKEYAEIGFSPEEIDKKIEKAKSKEEVTSLKKMKLHHSLMLANEKFVEQLTENYAEIKKRREAAAKSLSNQSIDSKSYAQVEKYAETVSADLNSLSKQVYEVSVSVAKTSKNFRDEIINYLDVSGKSETETGGGGQAGNNGVGDSVKSENPEENDLVNSSDEDGSLVSGNPLSFSEYESLGYNSSNIAARKKYLLSNRTTENANEYNNLWRLESNMRRMKDLENSADEAKATLLKSLADNLRAERLLIDTDENDPKYAPTEFLLKNTEKELAGNYRNFGLCNDRLKAQQERTHGFILDYHEKYGGFSES